jgi:ribosomal protein L12E/L44/L45/RPP1/RPP2
LQNYNPLIRAEEQMRERGIKTVVAGFGGLPAGVKIPAIDKSAGRKAAKAARAAESEAPEEDLNEEREQEFAASSSAQLSLSEPDDSSDEVLN